MPAVLRDQVAETYGSSDRKQGGRKPSHPQAPKQRPAHSRGADSDDEDEEQPPRAGPSRQPTVTATASKKRTSASKVPAEAESEAAPPPKKKKRELRLPTARTDDAEDGEIEWLEYALRNEKGKGKEEDSDGLDGKFRFCADSGDHCRIDGLPADLLDFADVIGPGGRGLRRNASAEAESDLDGDDLDIDGEVTGSDDDDDDEMDLDGLVGSEDEDGSVSDADPDDELDVDLSEGSEATDGDGDDGSLASDSNADAELNGGKNDTNGSTVPTPATPATKYIPPHLRAAQLAEKAQGSKEKTVERQKLERRTQGLLNKSVSKPCGSVLGLTLD